MNNRSCGGGPRIHRRREWPLTVGRQSIGSRFLRRRQETSSPTLALSFRLAALQRLPTTPGWLRPQAQAG